jgi:hypothetical protein
LIVKTLQELLNEAQKYYLKIDFHPIIKKVNEISLQKAKFLHRKYFSLGFTFYNFFYFNIKLELSKHVIELNFKFSSIFITNIPYFSNYLHSVSILTWYFIYQLIKDIFQISNQIIISILSKYLISIINELN